MTTSVEGPAPVVEPAAEQEWRSLCARASVIAGMIGLAVLALVLVANQTLLMDGISGFATMFQIEGSGFMLQVGGIAALAGVVTGFLGRRSRRGRTAVVGSALSWVAVLGFGWAAFSLPYFTYVRGLAWAPDGSRIAYSQDQAGIWVVGADGSSEPTQLVASGDSPVWSLDGTTIAYVAPAPNWGAEIWVVSTEGSSEPTQLTANGSSPARSPDGATIAYVAKVAFDQDQRGELWLMDADGGHPRQLTHLLSTQGEEVRSPSWSPDGSRVVFVGVPLEWGTESIWVVDTDGANLRQVTTEGGAPRWSPDGRRIAYVVPPSEGPWGTVWVSNVDGTGRTHLPCDSQGDPQWTPDGRIALDCSDGMHLMNPDGTNQQLLLAADQGKPLATESARVLSPDGTQVTYATGAGKRTDIVVHTIDGSTQITLIH